MGGTDNAATLEDGMRESLAAGIKPTGLRKHAVAELLRRGLQSWGKPKQDSFLDFLRRIDAMNPQYFMSQLQTAHQINHQEGHVTRSGFSFTERNLLIGFGLSNARVHQMVSDLLNGVDLFDQPRQEAA